MRKMGCGIGLPILRKRTDTGLIVNGVKIRISLEDDEGDKLSKFLIGGGLKSRTSGLNLSN